MLSYNEYLIKQIENTNLEFERFMKNRNYTLTLITIITTIFTAINTEKISDNMFVFIVIITLIYLLLILSINFKIRYIDKKEYYTNEKELSRYLVTCNEGISNCYNKMYKYTLLYVSLIILSLILINT